MENFKKVKMPSRRRQRFEKGSESNLKTQWFPEIIGNLRSFKFIRIYKYTYMDTSMNEKTLGRAEKLALTYESKKDQTIFLTGFIEGYNHLKGTGSGEIYEAGKAYGVKEFHEMVSRRDNRVFRKSMRAK